MLEIEKTYLAKFIPEELRNSPNKEIIDIYIPDPAADYPHLRVRKSGDDYTITKKQVVPGEDYSHQTEQTIKLSAGEFDFFRRHSERFTDKCRYYYSFAGMIVEFDVFRGELAGLVVIDFEFKDEEEYKKFQPPEFCLADVTNEDFICGGTLSGKNYSEIEPDLKRFNYKKL